VVAAWALARRLFGRRAGLLAAALLAVLPGHFMDRTMLGFVDHHALEALLAVSVILAFARALSTTVRLDAIVAGMTLGLYLLAWGSGAFLVAIVGAWLLLYVLVTRTSDSLKAAAALTAVAAIVALAVVLAFQHPSMHRYGSQILGLAGLALIAITIAIAMAISTRSAAARLLPLAPKHAALAMLGILAAVAAATVVVLSGDLVQQVLVDVGRFAPNPSRMGVLEARPLFLYTGHWSWAQPWTFFRTGFFIGAIALVPFAIRVCRRREPGDLMILIFAIATLVATIGQNRFGYYLVTACAVLGGWLATELLDWGGVPHADDKTPAPRTRLPLARELAVIAVAGVMFAPNLSPRVLLAERTATLPSYWRDTMQWLRDNTPPPFGNDQRGRDYYFARYSQRDNLAPAYSVMSWWDQGYWVTQLARRVPVANPTQERAAIAARFYSSTEETQARGILAAERARFVVSDYELPFRRLADGSIMGRFQTILDWTGAAHDRFYEIAYRRDGSEWMPVWIFHEPYYRSMAFRLSVAGGAAVTPVNTTTVAVFANRVDVNGLRFRELVADEIFSTYEAAQRAVNARSDAVIVGLDPWQSAFPLEALQSLVPVYGARTAEQKPTEAPWVRVFEGHEQPLVRSREGPDRFR
jgi:dolichyl-diphosphooligosaccharide--protein glycosyltransferase